MIKIDAIEALRELKKRYVKDKVSLLVGSGFSKNVWRDFPLWDQLLTDMIQELYQIEPEEAIKKYGYLRIVSEYIKSKGMRESIEDYIERRIPYMEKDQYLLKFVGKDPIPVKKSDFELHRKLLISRWEKIYTTNYDDILEFAADIYGLKWKAISSADNLTLNNETNNLIIKLHGTIYHQDSESKHSFEFDGNHHHRYIISQEDYDNYPKEHEAFTQLMKISLLQGTFCLIGFSGNDPNYISWISWVRDVLVRSSRGYGIKNAKVFLIDVSDDELTTDRQLFYMNYHIVHISLRDKNVLKLFRVADDGLNNKELIDKFIAYLNHDDILAEELNVSSKEVYNALWKHTLRVKDKRIQAFSSDAKDIQERMAVNRFVTQAISQQNFLFYILSKGTFSEDDITLILIAIRDTGVPFSYYTDLKERLKTVLVTDWQQGAFHELENRDLTLCNPFFSLDGTDDKTIYERILRTAFQLDFKELFISLDSWSPQANFVLMKAVWMSLFDFEIYKKLLKDYKENTQDSQEEYWAIEFLRITNLFDNLYSSTVIKYENMGLDSLYEIRDRILKQLLVKEKRIEPYGQITNEVDMNNEREYPIAMKALQFLMDFPCMPSIGYVSMIPSAKWYTIFKQIYEVHPYPALFYSLSIDDKNIQQRIGQDFSYSDCLYERGITREIVKRLFKCILEEKTPICFRTGAFVIIRELLYVVETSVWEKDFLLVWHNILLPVIDKADDNPELVRFINGAVPLLETPSIIETIIKNCLAFSKESRSISLSVLYNITKYDRKLEIDLTKEINEFIERFDDIDDVQILGTIFFFLTNEHKQKVCNKLLLLNDGRIVIKKYINALCHFAKHDASLMKSLKEAIMSSKRLWDNGILSSGGITHAYCLHITQFHKILRWTDEEIKQLYEKLRTSALEVFNNVMYKKGSSPFSVFGITDDLFVEMSKFITTYRKQLQSVNGIDELYFNIKDYLKSIQGYTDIEDGLLSDNGNIVIKAISELIYNINCDSISENLIELIADRVLFNKRDGFEQSVQALTYYVKKYSRKVQISNTLIHKILLILERNDKVVLMRNEYDLIEVLYNFVSLAQSMKDLGEKNCIIQKWVNLGESGRFNFQSRNWWLS